MQIQNDHTQEEIIAAAICQRDAALGQWVFAVGRKCAWPYETSSCDEICENERLKYQDQQVKDAEMYCASAYHVYGNRPVTYKFGEATSAKLGLKTRRETCDHKSCGPNFCCCIAF